MPKPFYGEEMTVIEAGEYDVIITQVINLGHQTWKDKAVTKFWIEFWIPNLNMSKEISNFGIMTWLSPSKPPFVGFYELISAVTNNQALTQGEAKEYNVYDLAGKPVVVVFSQNEKGFMNITGVKSYSGEDKLSCTEEIIVVGTEDFKNNELLDKIPDKARQLIWQSREFMEDSEIFSGKPTEVAEKVEIGGYDAKANLDSVPF